MRCLSAVLLTLAISVMIGCNKDPQPKGGVNITAPGVSVKVDGGGVDVKAPGTQVTVPPAK
jgi:hypothetical protein